MTEYTDDGDLDVDVDVEAVHLRDGTRLTEARASEIAEQTLISLRRGRPSLSEGSRRSPQVSFRVPEQTRRQLDERARAEGRNPSDVAREALQRYLETPAS